MSLEFVKNKTGSASIDLAVKQQDQISYFVQSSIQDEINFDYLQQWAERKYVTNDYFLNYVKAVLKTENFLSFFKYMRKPLPSARLVNDKIKGALERVFHAEDSYCKYVVRGEEIDEPEELEIEKFQNKLFNALLFSHNDIIVHDLKDVNTPYRQFVSIKNVVAIKSKDSVIHKLAYTANIDGVNGYLYLDKHSYIFYNKDFTELLNIPHDLGECPADYVSKDPFSNEEDDVVRKSIFSYIKEEFEEYVFLKTLQRMTEPNGAIPIVSMLDVKEKGVEGKDKKGSPGEPMSSSNISGQKATQGGNVIGVKGSPQQAGSVLKVPVVKKTDGSIDMDVVKNFFNFFYIPTDALNYLNDRIAQIEKSIIVNTVGDHSEEKEQQKNELQVSKSYVQKQDKLRALSNQITRARNRSDYKMLALKFGKDTVDVDVFQGSDFFIETQEDLFKQFKDAPNGIIRKNLLVRISQNANKFNPTKAAREKLLYDLMPYSNDKDFDLALSRNTIDDTTFNYQTRFTYWIDVFESKYGDILFFWEMIEGTTSEKLTLINNLITNIIKEYYEQQSNSTPTSVLQ